MIHKIFPFVDYNKWSKHLDTQLNEPTNKNSIKDRFVVRQTNKKLYYETLGTSVILSTMSPPSLPAGKECLGKAGHNLRY